MDTPSNSLEPSPPHDCKSNRCNAIRVTNMTECSKLKLGASTYLPKKFPWAGYIRYNAAFSGHIVFTNKPMPNLTLIQVTVYFSFLRFYAKNIGYWVTLKKFFLSIVPQAVTRTYWRSFSSLQRLASIRWDPTVRDLVMKV